MRITTEQYFEKHIMLHRLELTDSIKANAEITVNRVNALLDAVARDGIGITLHPESMSPISSGWRPPEVNAATPGAAVNSKHMTGQACDLYDPDGELDEWCLANLNILRELGLWMEHPSATKGWCHVQTEAPKSGRTVFYP